MAEQKFSSAWKHAPEEPKKAEAEAEAEVLDENCDRLPEGSPKWLTQKDASTGDLHAPGLRGSL